MKIALCSAFAMLSISTASLAQDEAYVLTLPLEFGENLGSDVCLRFANENTSCGLLEVTPPGAGPTIEFTALTATGSLEYLLERFASDFVPWPWSSIGQEITYVESGEMADFVPWPWALTADGAVVFDRASVIETLNQNIKDHGEVWVTTNPCLMATCGEGTICVARFPANSPTCVPVRDPQPEASRPFNPRPFVSIIPLGSIRLMPEG